MSTEAIEEGVQSVGLEEGKEEAAGGDLDQSSFFRAVADGHVSSINALLKNRKKIDVNAYTTEGATALHLAVYKYEVGRDLAVATTLLAHGADVSIKAAPPPPAHKIAIVRHDPKHHGTQETKKISYDHKTPLLIALEIKSSLYLKGWEYRHWDSLIKVLADATIDHYAAKKLEEPSSVHPNAVSDVIQHNWDAVFKSGKHELVELVAEGKDIVALRLLVTGASKMLRLNLVETDRVEIRDTSYNMAKAMVHFLYVGKLDPAFVQHRGIDLFVAAHKYGVIPLKRVLEAGILPTQENWIKLLNASVDSNSDVLTLKVARSIKDVMDGRQNAHGFLRKNFSEIDAAPNQLYSSRS